MPQGNSKALAAAIAEILDDAHFRERLAEGARQMRDRLPTWQESSRKMAEALQRLATDGPFQR